MSDAGWIKLHRRLLDWEWYSDTTTFRLFMHILLKANFKKSRFQGMEVPAGGFVTSAKSISAATGLTNSQIRTSLSKLERTNEIAIKTTNKFSIISIVKWSGYQTDDNQIANKSQSNSKQIATEEEGKKERKEETNGQFDLGDEGGFDDWYQHYPKKEARQKAIAAYNKAVKLVGHQTLVDGAKRYADFVRGREKKFIKQPATWLNGGCWADELDDGPRFKSHLPFKVPEFEDVFGDRMKKDGE